MPKTANCKHRRGNTRRAFDSESGPAKQNASEPIDGENPGARNGSANPHIE